MKLDIYNNKFVLGLNFKDKKMNKVIKLILELITFPLYLSLEIIIIFLLIFNYSY